MEVIIYSTFIVLGIAGISYYAVKKRYVRLLEEEQEKAYSAKNNELQLASEKQKLESVLKEKEHQLAEVRTHEESRSISLSSEVLSKDKQIQSLSAQLHKEMTDRTTLEKNLSEKEEREKLLTQQLQQEESRSSSLQHDVTSKEKTVQSLSEELSKETALRLKTAEELSEKVRTIEILSERITQEEKQRSMQMDAMTNKEQEFQTALTGHSIKREQLQNDLQKEIENRTALEQRFLQLQGELTVAQTNNDSLRITREQYAEEFRQREQEYQTQLSETALQLTTTKVELERTAELLQEQTDIRQATEHALQESKQKLYALINEQEQKLKEQTNTIVVLQSKLAERSNDLILAEQSIYNIIRLVPIPAFVVNINGICEFCNSSLELLVGYGMDELRDRHFSRLFPDDERSFFEEQWKNSVNRSEQFQGETNIIAATNDTISASMNIVPIQTNSSEDKYIGFLVDHTIEHDAKKHFTAAKEREQELLDLKSRFIGMVSNQLRTSLVTIATNTELLERFLDKWSDERRYHSFLRINESIRQLIELVRDVTFTTKASTEPYPLMIANINLEALFQSTARELIADLESHHHFILSEQGDISSIPLDEKLIKTIAQQLLSNAFKYSRDNTEVKVHIAQNQTSCVITITDHGIGIPATEQKHLFSSFFRASNVNNIYGTGLGLTIVQQCAQLHHGTVSIESELNKGTTVTVSLPLSKNFPQ